MTGEYTLFIFECARSIVHGLEDVTAEAVHHRQTFSEELKEDTSDKQ